MGGHDEVNPRSLRIARAVFHAARAGGNLREGIAVERGSSPKSSLFRAKNRSPTISRFTETSVTRSVKIEREAGTQMGSFQIQQ